MSAGRPAEERGEPLPRRIQERRAWASSLARRDTALPGARASSMGTSGGAPAAPSRQSAGGSASVLFLSRAASSSAPLFFSRRVSFDLLI